MPALIPWLGILALVAAAYPVASRRVSAPGLRLALTLALGLGGLSQVMLWEGLLGIPFTPLGIAAPYLLIMGVALWVTIRAEKSSAAKPQFATLSLRFSASLRSLRFNFLIILIAAAVLFNSAWWLFHRDDALGIYQPQAAQLYALGGLIPLRGADSLYLAYPMHNQLLYAYAYLISGWENEYLASFVGALLSVGCLPAVYALSERLRAGSGGVAALLLATAPTFAAWASAGYVDLPSAFYITLSAVFLLRLWEDRRATDVALAGLMLGLAAWTKNAALVLIPLMGVWLAWAWLRGRIALQHGLIALAACALIAAPWYIRNLAGAGFIIPDTAWTDQAQHTVSRALLFILQPQDYGVTGWLMLAGVAWALVRGKAGERLILLLTLPFFGVWWLFASYDPRFLLLILPLPCALAGALLIDLWNALAQRRRTLRPILWLIALALTARAVWFSIEYKSELAVNPFMDDAAKRIILEREPSP
jgi:4-amino-4-deoxy-L-arabinose transferase-like glycosyltransferase